MDKPDSHRGDEPQSNLIPSFDLNAIEQEAEKWIETTFPGIDLSTTQKHTLMAVYLERAVYAKELKTMIERVSELMAQRNAQNHYLDEKLEKGYKVVDEVIQEKNQMILNLLEDKLNRDFTVVLN